MIYLQPDGWSQLQPGSNIGIRGKQWCTRDLGKLFMVKFLKRLQCEAPTPVLSDQVRSSLSSCLSTRDSRCSSRRTWRGVRRAPVPAALWQHHVGGLPRMDCGGLPTDDLGKPPQRENREICVLCSGRVRSSEQAARNRLVFGLSFFYFIFY